ncbi:hypothetical protein [Nostoc sp.]
MATWELSSPMKFRVFVGENAWLKQIKAWPSADFASNIPHEFIEVAAEI